jgi:peptide/nickel transport system ATP-binding protein
MNAPSTTVVPTLALDGLTTEFVTPLGIARAVNGVDLSVERGKILGLVGESGSGKSITGFSILGLIDPPGRIVGGRILFHGKDLRELPEAELRRLRGARMAMIFQDPMMTLNPVLRVGTQMVEAIQAHRPLGHRAALAEAEAALTRVGISSAAERLQCYPHQLSGGMRQRIAIAIAILNEPDLIIADEPTTALDVSIQAQILLIGKQLCNESHMAMIWITHDLAVVATLADEIAVMYAGRIVEHGPADEVIRHPLHPYTIGLLNSLPGNNPRGSRLQQIPGMAPPLTQIPAGCSFRPRCPRATTRCGEEPGVTQIGVNRSVRCFHPNMSAGGADEA